MSKIKVQETLLTFDKKELGRLQKFIDSPYFNNGYNADSLQNLFVFLRKNGDKVINKDKLQSQFYPGKPFVEKQKNAIDNLLTDLNTLVETFIVYEESQERIQANGALVKARYFSRLQRTERIWPLINRYRRQ